MRLVPRRGTIACRRPTAALAEGTYVTQGATQAMLPGTWSERVLPAFACPSPVSTSRADRSIGRHDARAGRGTGRILPPAATAPAPHSRIPSRKASLNERDSLIRWNVTKTVTNVNPCRSNGDTTQLSCKKCVLLPRIASWAALLLYLDGEKTGADTVSAEAWNLIAAMLCTMAATITAYALLVLYFSAPTFVNEMAAIGGGVGTLGGIAWIIAAVIGVRQR